MQSEQTTSAGLNYYRDENKQRQAAAPGGSARRQRQASVRLQQKAARQRGG